MRALSHSLLCALVSALLAGAAVSPPAAAADPALVPPASGGFAAVDRALSSLTQHRRLLVIAAHPDDESTDLLTLVSRGMGGDAAYLALSRGDGGQNLIGDELGEALGVLRSRELEAARSIDGARQFFTRAYDFGYTRSIDETFARWPRRELLLDVVRVIRRFQPQVVVAIFPPDERAGHGQHQASGIVAREAFELAGDPAAFPELAAEGLTPWRPSDFYRFAWWDRSAATQVLTTGGLDPISGRSVHQVAMESRSQHRSQDMGSLQELGARELPLVWEAGAAGAVDDTVDGDGLFAGIDTRLEAIAGLLEEPAARRAVADLLGEVRQRAEGLRGRLTATGLGDAARELAEILSLLQQAQERIATRPGGAGSTAQAAALVAEKIAAAETGMLAASGIVLDAVADREVVVPGGPLEVRAQLWNAGPLEIVPEAVTLSGALLAGEPPASFALEAADSMAAPPPGGGGNAPFGSLLSGSAQLLVQPGAEATVPYFLSKPRVGDLYDWSDTPAAARGLPFGPPVLTARFHLRLGDLKLAVDREVVYRYRDQAQGEVRRPLRVVPQIQIAASPDLLIWRRDTAGPKQLEVAVELNTLTSNTATIQVKAPAGWQQPWPVIVDTEGGAQRSTVLVTIDPPDTVVPGRHTIGIRAQIFSSPVAETAYPLIDYPHIRPTAVPRPATVETQVIDLELPALRRVAYLRGASDRVPEALLQIGLPVELVTTDQLASADLSRFDALVIGSRAYETEPALAGIHHHLLDWVRAGGLLIVQFQQYQFVSGGFPALPLEIARPHGRVTDETAPVTALLPDHPFFHTPNEIGPADWQGWVQERGLYFAGTWDAGYTPLLAMADPGGEEQRGSLLVAPYGQGTYVYTGLAFFRQLPAGVPGAFRLFANLLALGASPPVAQAASPAESLLARSITFHDPDNVWANGAFELELRETRPDGPDRERTVVIDNAAGRFSLTGRQDGVLVEQTLDAGGCRFAVDEAANPSAEQVEALKLDCERLARMRNYYSYLWGLPMKLRDPGTLLDPEVKTDTFDGHEALALRVTYDETVGSDTWYFYFDPESAALIGYRFYHDEAAKDGEYITLAGEAELRVDGDLLLRLPRERTWYTYQGDRLLGTDTLIELRLR